MSIYNCLRKRGVILDLDSLNFVDFVAYANQKCLSFVPTVTKLLAALINSGGRLLMCPFYLVISVDYRDKRAN